LENVWYWLPYEPDLRRTGVDLETAIAVGHPMKQIEHRAETEHVDQIVLGRRGVARFERMIVGSTSENVVRYARCSVMVVR
jgi:nucleotide-binding universal stress UspA family protein